MSMKSNPAAFAKTPKITHKYKALIDFLKKIYYNIYRKLRKGIKKCLMILTCLKLAKNIMMI